MSYLSVSNLHHLYYETLGEPSNTPILFLHGGPGAGFSEDEKEFFDPEKHYVIFFDQRGAGRSKPFGSIKENTTDHLVEDINTILDYFQLETVWLFGGSWGSTLALVYAIRYPQRVRGLILRGIFLGNQAGIDHFVGGGAAPFYPEYWKRFISHVPAAERERLVAFYLEKMLDKDDETRRHFAYEWAFYEMAIYKQNLTETEITVLVEGLPFESLGIMEAYYSANRCFLPDNYILDHCAVIKDLPIAIVQGRQDMICPPQFAYQLYQRLNNATLTFTNAGHAAGETETKAALIDALILVKK
ncbi:MAG: prolyl aminopeptidase [Saprospiraceae bacterium]